MANDDTQAAVAALWSQYRPIIAGRVTVLEQATRAALDDALSDELRQKAYGEAHKLAGSMGTFGFADASEMAREAEMMLDREAPLDAAAVACLSDLVRAIRQRIEGGANAHETS